jgi:hypothetical protein
MDKQDEQFNIMTSRMLRREALRRAAEELNTTFPAGLEDVMARISAEVTADAAARIPAPRITVSGITVSDGATKPSLANGEVPPRVS